jgi:thymidylate synthase (FAD)
MINRVFTRPKTVVRLISHSMPSYLSKDSKLSSNNNPICVQDLIAYCARVSNPSGQNNKESNDKLLSFLVRENHWSPFETVSACLEIETPRDIARQILRHRSFSFQEFSQRYADPTKDLDFVLREARLQDNTNRQNSLESNDVELSAQWDKMQKEVIQQSLKAYNFAIDNGIAKEQARAVLPEGNTMSKLYMNGTLRSWVHYINLRSAHGTQKEHIEVAQQCSREIAKILPLITKLSSSH